MQATKYRHFKMLRNTVNVSYFNAVTSATVTAVTAREFMHTQHTKEILIYGKVNNTHVCLVSHAYGAHKQQQHKKTPEQNCSVSKDRFSEQHFMPLADA